jgi:hypothetical protein
MLFVAGMITATVTVAACGSTTNGSGRAGLPGAPSTSEPGFPSTPVTTPAETTPVAPASTRATQTIHPAPSVPLRSVTVHAVDGATYVVKVWADVRDDTCFDHAYGQPIIGFLTRHPCSDLHRYLATTSVNGRPVGLNESATGFAGTAENPYRDASRFSELEEADGTGSLNDLLREGYRLPSGPTSVPSPDAFNVLGQDQGVTVWDVWYLDGPTPANDPALIKMTQDVFLQF